MAKGVPFGFAFLRPRRSGVPSKKMEPHIEMVQKILVPFRCRETPVRVSLSKRGLVFEAQRKAVPLGLGSPKWLGARTKQGFTILRPTTTFPIHSWRVLHARKQRKRMRFGLCPAQRRKVPKSTKQKEDLELLTFGEKPVYHLLGLKAIKLLRAQLTADLQEL